MKTVLITGAYRGLGFEVARQLSERGWEIILTARRKDQGSAAAAKLKTATFLENRVEDRGAQGVTRPTPGARGGMAALIVASLCSRGLRFVHPDYELSRLR